MTNEEKETHRLSDKSDKIKENGQTEKYHKSLHNNTIATVKEWKTTLILKDRPEKIVSFSLQNCIFCKTTLKVTS